MDIWTYEFLKSRRYTLLIIILLISGWVLIMGSIILKSQYLTFEHSGSMFPSYEVNEPGYSSSLLLAPIGLVALAAMHVFIYLKFKLKLSLVATLLLIIGAYAVLVAAVDGLSDGDFNYFNRAVCIYPFYFSIIFGFGIEGLTYISLNRVESILTPAGLFTMFMGIPLVLLISFEQQLEVCAMILFLILILPLTGFVNIYRKELNYPIGPRIYNP
jgi:hypothetical protein